MNHDVLNELKRISLFANVSDRMLLKLVDRMKQIQFKKNARIVNEGDDGNSLYFILSGKVRVSCLSEEGKEFILQDQQSGSYFGELALLCQEPRSASVDTLENTDCAVVYRADFVNWLRENPEITIDLLGEVSKMAMLLTRKAKDLATSDIYQRLRKLFLAIAEDKDGKLVISNSPSQDKLGKILGASRESINKIFSRLLQGGYIVQDKKMNHIIITKKLPLKY